MALTYSFMLEFFILSEEPIGILIPIRLFFDTFKQSRKDRNRNVEVSIVAGNYLCCPPHIISVPLSLLAETSFKSFAESFNLVVEKENGDSVSYAQCFQVIALVACILENSLINENMMPSIVKENRQGRIHNNKVKLIILG